MKLSIHMKLLCQYSKILPIVLGLYYQVAAQEKYEVEHHIRAVDVPSEALDVVEELNFKRKVKWYYEENLKGNSYEAKIKSQRHYSIEFDTLGNFQDIEVEIPWTRVDSVVQRKIDQRLQEEYSFHKFRKIQLQYFDKQHLPKAIARKTLSFDVPHRYEIVIEGKKNNTYQLYEVTFDQGGDLIKTYHILPGNSDILEY